ncbi:Cell envelope-associated transcriptional attenuator LytR-CpsA-Psr, subfamily F2 (as in) [Clostridiaceae bacterium JG1575]|nr:Cell envelope-associated transcriptional attenuator LytR-CpsA-Psr, subfamily F2 (as in) [Clostridiaceae bacterium JG1575]
MKKVFKTLALFLVLLLILAAGSIWFYLNKIPREAVKPFQGTEDPAVLTENHIPTNTNSLGTSKEALASLQAKKNYKKVTNILVLGIDSSNGSGRSDAMMLVSVDSSTRQIKLTSLIRDSYVYIAGNGMDKLNHAYAFGGPSLALRAVNTNFDLDVQDFVTVNFSSTKSIVDALGGLNLKLSKEEAKIIGAPGEGVQHLNGTQVLNYARIRKIDNDFQRTSRQRNVMTAVLQDLMKLGPIEKAKAAEHLLPMVKTSLSNSKILGLGSSMLMGGYSIEENSFPEDDTSQGVLIKDIYYLKWNQQETIRKMHAFIYNE